MIIHPSLIRILTLLKIDFASAWNLKEMLQVLETSGRIMLSSLSCPPPGKECHMVKILEISFKRKGYCMNFYSRTGILRIILSHTIVTAISFST